MPRSSPSVADTLPGVRALTVLGVAAVALVSAAAPSLAHPFGPPPTAFVSARGHSVFVEWAAAADDAIAVGESIGLFEEGTAEQYWEAPVQVAPPAHKEEELSASPGLRDYLLERIQVRQDGVLCAGTVQPIGNFVRDGAVVVYRCPAEVAVVDLHIAMLHDVHDAYRTFAISEGDAQPAQAVFTSTESEHRWDFTAPAEDGPPAAGNGGGMTWWPLAVGGGAAIVIAAALALLVGRSPTP
jgi:hypothetical protein